MIVRSNQTDTWLQIITTAIAERCAGSLQKKTFWAKSTNF
jgi:hypothetical protein